MPPPPPPSKRARVGEKREGAPATQESAAPPNKVAPPLSISELLDMDSSQSISEHLAKWGKDAEECVDKAIPEFIKARGVSAAHFKVPGSVMPIPPLKISSAASGAHLTSFREAMNYDNSSLIFSAVRGGWDGLDA